MDAAESIWQDLLWETIQAERWISGKAWLHFRLLSLCRRWGGWRFPPAGHPCQETAARGAISSRSDLWRKGRCSGGSDAVPPLGGHLPLDGAVHSRYSPKQSQRCGAAAARLLGRALQQSSSPCLQQALIPAPIPGSSLAGFLWSLFLFTPCSSLCVLASSRTREVTCSSSSSFSP